MLEAWTRGQGPHAWPVCSQQAGLTRGGGSPDVHPASAAKKTPVKTSVEDVKPHSTPQSRAGTAEMYTVVRGDSLSRIAETEHVRGGWQRLYSANRKTIGADPDLILPGQRLNLRESLPPPGVELVTVRELAPGERAPQPRATSQCNAQ